MKCREFAAIVHDLAHRGELDPSLGAIARAHAEACPSCGSRLTEAEKLAKALRGVAADSRPLGAPPQVEAALLGAFRRKLAGEASARVQKKFRWRLALGWTGACAAASVLVFVLLGYGPDRRTSPAVRVRATASTTAGGSGTEKALAKEPEGAGQGNLGSGFVPVPYTGNFGPGDSAVIVRVQVPRASLAELGYPVDETQGEGVVQADLVIGEDGWPRAVRIVQGQGGE